MNRILQLITVSCFCLLSLHIVTADEGANKTWPIIKPFEENFEFNNASTASVVAVIVGSDDRPLYKVECHTDNYEGDPDFDYSGDFECRLTSLYSIETYSTLLTDNPKQSRDWESRGRFLVQEIIGECADYPEYGLVRHFRLRGMEITLTIKKPVFGKAIKKGRPELKSFNFAVNVKPDSSARTKIAEPVPYIKPPRANPNDPNNFSLKCDAMRK
ncbi:MAG: hypothetical protein HQL08_11030 [Nitrospirae bacterium]|nr:hypothetical protein [Nitrospirota bacterium]